MSSLKGFAPTKRLILIISVVVLAAAGRAQEPAFDVASVRPNVSGGNTSFQPMPNGQLTVTNAPLRTLIVRAFRLHDSQVIDAPEWTAVERYDVLAKADPPPAGGPDALMPMLRTLLEERFQLKARRETRELSAYVLGHARSDRRLGAQIRPTQADCTAGPRLMSREELMAVAKQGWPPCGQAVTVSFVERTADGTTATKIRVRRSAITMAEFATFLQSSVGRPIVDRTGLEGVFDVEYSFAPQPSGPATELAGGPNLPPIFVALEEQLGLKLESQRAEVPVLVIDSVDRPTAN